MSLKSFLLRPIYPFLLTLFFVLHGFAESFFMTEATDMLRLLLIYLVVTTMLFLLAFWLFRSTYKAALFTFLLLCFDYFFGYVHDLMKTAFPGSFIIKYSVILGVALVFFVALAIILKKKSNLKLTRPVLYLNILFIIFIVIDLFTIGRNIYSDASKKEEKVELSCTKERPDVYFIIADDYAGKVPLKNIYGFDNSPFIDSLHNRGFFVAENSQSNYNYTAFSIASMLNMEYLHFDRANLDGAGDCKPALNMIYNNKIVTFFEQLGYSIHNYSTVEIRDYPAAGKSGFLPERDQLFTAQTLVDRFHRDAWIHVAVWLNLKNSLEKNAFKTRAYNQKVYDQTLTQLKTNSATPKFVYTHLEMPHFPFYFDDKGNAYTFEQMEADHGRGSPENYVRYLKYVNTKLLYLVDSILQSSRTPPIIILASDHGHNIFTEDNMIYYTFVNLLSVHLPGKDYSQFNDSLTNVNLFRVVLNTKFCQQLPILKDSMVSNKDWEKGRVGDQVKAPAKFFAPGISQSNQTQDSPDRQLLQH